jgi:hypothetical protein
MEVFILSKDQFSQLTQRLDELQNLLNAKSDASNKPFMDNEAFVAFMGISKRTAQTWRDEGKISFSQIGTKIYYKSVDVDKLLNDNYFKSFKK